MLKIKAFAFVWLGLVVIIIIIDMLCLAYALSFSIYSQLLLKSKKPTPRRCFLPVRDSMKICNGTRNWNWLKFPKYGMAHAICSYLNAIVNLELLKIIVEWLWDTRYTTHFFLQYVRILLHVNVYFIQGFIPYNNQRDDDASFLW